MKREPARVTHEVVRFIRFGMVGSMNAAVDFSIFFIATEYGSIHYLPANALAWFVAVCFSFMMNSLWTFKAFSKGKAVTQYSKFFLVSVIALVWSSAFLYLFVDVLLLTEIVGKVLSAGIVMFWNYFVHKHWTFRNAGSTR